MLGDAENVSFSIKSTWIGTGAAFNECGHIEFWRDKGVGGQKFRGSLGAWISCDKQADAR